MSWARLDDGDVHPTDAARGEEADGPITRTPVGNGPAYRDSLCKSRALLVIVARFTVHGWRLAVQESRTSDRKPGTVNLGLWTVNR